jgi:hypothetical protein
MRRAIVVLTLASLLGMGFLFRGARAAERRTADSARQPRAAVDEVALIRAALNTRALVLPAEGLVVDLCNTRTIHNGLGD